MTSQSPERSARSSAAVESVTDSALLEELTAGVSTGSPDSLMVTYDRRFNVSLYAARSPWFCASVRTNCRAGR